MLFQDLRITVRHLRKSPGFSATAVLMLALGIGATTAIFSMMDSLLFEVSPFDPIVLTLSALFVVLLAIAASLIPAQRAASIDPMQALRAE